MAIWDPNEIDGGLTADQARDASETAAQGDFKVAVARAEDQRMTRPEILAELGAEVPGVAPLVEGGRDLALAVVEIAFDAP